MPTGLGFMVQAILGMMGSQSLLHVGALSVRLSEEISCFNVCSVRSSCVLYLVVVSMVVLSKAILCPVVHEWWAGADWLWEKSSGLCKWSLKWDSCSLILLIKGRFVCPCTVITRNFINYVGSEVRRRCGLRFVE